MLFQFDTNLAPNTMVNKVPYSHSWHKDLKPPIL